MTQSDRSKASVSSWALLRSLQAVSRMPLACTFLYQYFRDHDPDFKTDSIDLGSSERFPDLGKRERQF